MKHPDHHQCAFHAFYVCRVLQQSDCNTMMSSLWPSVRQCLTMLTASTILHDQLNELWYQHNHELQNSQGDLSSYLAGLTQLGHLLPVMLEMLVDIREGCSFPILHNITLQDRVAIELHLLVRNHQVSEAVRNLLEEAAAYTTNCVVDVWQVAVPAIQASMKPLAQSAVPASMSLLPALLSCVVILHCITSCPSGYCYIPQESAAATCCLV